MNTRSITLALLLFAAAFFCTGCGGGDDTDGQPEPARCGSQPAAGTQGSGPDVPAPTTPCRNTAL